MADEQAVHVESAPTEQQEIAVAAAESATATEPSKPEKPETYSVPRPIQAADEPYDDFVIRLQDWNLDKRQFQQSIADKKQAEVKAIQTNREKAAAQIAAGQAKYQDFQEVVSDVVMPNAIVNEVLDSE